MKQNKFTKRKNTLIKMLIGCAIFMSNIFANVNIVDNSKIESVKIYQNQALISRTLKVKVISGENKILIKGLPKILYDWSVKAKLPNHYKGKILSLEVQKKALISKKQSKIAILEKKIANLKEQDYALIDELKSIKSQIAFINNVLDFTKQTASTELKTRIPQVQVWDRTLTYSVKKIKNLNQLKRNIEKKREILGKKIRKWEFDLSEIAGYRYYNEFQTMNKNLLSNRSSLQVQQFDTRNYSRKQRYFNSTQGKIETEKQIMLHLFSSSNKTVEFRVSYLIPYTYWKMKYDLRAGLEKKSMKMIIFGNIYQKTGEDWNNIDLFLSTGSPQNSLHQPILGYWALSVYTPYKRSKRSGFFSKSKKAYRPSMAIQERQVQDDEKSKEDKFIPTSKIKTKGVNFEIQIPLKQSLESSTKYQKKYLKEYTLKNKKSVEYFYELTPVLYKKSFIKTKLTNNTEIPWLAGKGQIFLDNEFMGKVNVPFVPIGKSKEIVLGRESRITSEKKLIKKYEDTSGLFGGNRKIDYEYEITIENNLLKSADVKILDRFPISTNEKIQIKLLSISIPYIQDSKTKKTYKFKKGLRTWKFKMPPKQKKKINYKFSIVFDKDLNIRGLR